MMSPIRNALRQRLSLGQRRRLADVRIHVRRPSARLRILPGFLVLGAQRCGTSTVYRSLIDHPQVAPPVRKEVNYFARNWSRDETWYRAHFPLRLGGRTSLDCTPDYLFDADAPRRVRDMLGSPPMVVLLRDPMRRAHSHYQHNRRKFHDDLSFADALRAEPDRLSRARAAQTRDLWRYSYVARGLYAEQLERWFTVHPRDRFLVLFFEDLITDGPGVLRQIERHVGIDDWAPPTLENWSYKQGRPSAAASQLPEECAGMLSEAFDAPNRRLAELLGRELPW